MTRLLMTLFLTDKPYAVSDSNMSTDQCLYSD